MHALKFIEYGASVQKGDTNGHFQETRQGDLFRLLVPSVSITVFEVVFGQVRRTQTAYPMTALRGSSTFLNTWTPEYLDT